MARKKIPAVAYLRTSSQTNANKGLSSDKDSDRRQREAVMGFAAANGYEVVAEFYDVISGADLIDQRPGFSALLDRIEGNGVRTVLVEDASRFARELMTQELGILALIKRDVRVLTANGDDLTDSSDPSRKMMRQIAGSFAEYEKARLVAKLRSARERKRRETGKPQIPCRAQSRGGCLGQAVAAAWPQRGSAFTTGSCGRACAARPLQSAPKGVLVECDCLDGGWRVMPRTKAPGKATRRRASRTTVPAPQQPVTVAVEPSVGDPIAAPRPASGITLVEFCLLWLVGLVYFFITAPAGMSPLPVAAGWVIIGTTLFSLIVLGKRFPMFGLFLLMLITGLMSGGRRRRGEAMAGYNFVG